MSKGLSEGHRGGGTTPSKKVAAEGGVKWQATEKNGLMWWRLVVAQAEGVEKATDKGDKGDISSSSNFLFNILGRIYADELFIIWELGDCFHSF